MQDYNLHVIVWLVKIVVYLTNVTAVFTGIPLERQRRWFKDSIDHLLAIAQSPICAETGVFLSSGLAMRHYVISPPYSKLREVL